MSEDQTFKKIRVFLLQPFSKSDHSETVEWVASCHRGISTPVQFYEGACQGFVEKLEV